MSKVVNNRKDDTRRTIVYVDARNLYMGLLKHENKLAWFDIEGFILGEYSELVNIKAIKYFTSPGKDDLKEPLEAYHQAIQWIRHGESKLAKPFFGKVISGERPTCPKCGYNLNGHGSDSSKSNSYKEKQSDISMAVEVLTDVLHPNEPVQKVVLITNDSDFAPLIKKIKFLRSSCDVVVLAPTQKRSGMDPSKRNDWICYDLHNCARYYTSLRSRNLTKYRLPEEITGPEGQVVKCPERWRNRSA